MHPIYSSAIQTLNHIIEMITARFPTSLQSHSSNANVRFCIDDMIITASPFLRDTCRFTVVSNTGSTRLDFGVNDSTLHWVTEFLNAHKKSNTQSTMFHRWGN